MTSCTYLATVSVVLATAGITILFDESKTKRIRQLSVSFYGCKQQLSLLAALQICWWMLCLSPGTACHTQRLMEQQMACMVFLVQTLVQMILTDQHQKGVCDVGVALKGRQYIPCLQCQLPASTAAASGLGHASLSSQSPLLAASGCKGHSTSCLAFLVHGMAAIQSSCPCERLLHGDVPGWCCCSSHHHRRRKTPYCPTTRDLCWPHLNSSFLWLLARCTHPLFVLPSPSGCMSTR